jgi:hypothetical protein
MTAPHNKRPAASLWPCATEDRRRGASADPSRPSGVAAAALAGGLYKRPDEDVYRLCYVRGPEGILIGLAERIG